MQVGIGYDIHRLIPDRKLILGGVTIDYPLGFLAHSDGDVVIHAVIDALLGAAAMGDIGEMFPDTDPEYKDADSTKLLERVLGMIGEKGYKIVHVDVIVHAEKPKLSSHKPQIREKLARLMALKPDQVNVKAKTNEGFDAVGQGQAIAAWAAATLDRIDNQTK